MRKTIVCAAAALMPAFHLAAQSGIDRTLAQIEQNNPTLNAAAELAGARKLEARQGNTLYDPVVSYDYLWSNPSSLGRSQELNVVQGFDFPTLYAARSKMAKLQAGQYDGEQALLRQQLLLDAKRLCLEVIYLRKQNQLLVDKHSAAVKLADIYAAMLKAGEANAIEANRAQMECISITTELGNNEITLKTRLKQLAALNGNVDPEFTDGEYPRRLTLLELDSLKAIYVSSDPAVANYRNMVAVARQGVSVSRSGALPKFEVGYRYETALEDSFNGIKLGMSVPLFESRHSVKKAKAEVRAAEAQLAGAETEMASTVEELYDRVQLLQSAVIRTEAAVKNTMPQELFSKSLAAGEISEIHYMDGIYASFDNILLLLDLQMQYQVALAELYQFEL